MADVPSTHHYVSVTGVPKGKRKEVTKTHSLGYDTTDALAIPLAKSICDDTYKPGYKAVIKLVVGVSSVHDGVRFFKAGLFGSTSIIAPNGTRL